jgi:bacteriorhodopsin
MTQLISSSIWGITYSGNVIGLDAEIVAYAVLDVLQKPVFGLWLLLTLDSVSSTYVSIISSLVLTNAQHRTPSLEGFWAHGFGSQGSLRVGDDDEGA